MQPQNYLFYESISRVLPKLNTQGPLLTSQNVNNDLSIYLFHSSHGQNPIPCLCGTELQKIFEKKKTINLAAENDPNRTFWGGKPDTISGASLGFAPSNASLDLLGSHNIFTEMIFFWGCIRFVSLCQKHFISYLFFLGLINYLLSGTPGPNSVCALLTFSNVNTF